MDSIFDLSLGLSSTTGRAVKADNIASFELASQVKIRVHVFLGVISGVLVPVKLTWLLSI